MDKPNEVFMTDAQIQELAYGIAWNLPFSIAQIQRVEGVLKRIRAVYEGNGYEPTLDGEMWEPLTDKAYTMPDGKYLATDGDRLIIKREPEEYIKLPSSVRLCKRTSKTLNKNLKKESRRRLARHPYEGMERQDEAMGDEEAWTDEVIAAAARNIVDEEWQAVDPYRARIEALAKQVRDDMQAVPDWSQAPAWANFWTRDAGGVTMWWETRPIYDGRMGIWMCEDDTKRTRGTDLAVLRSRPTA